MKRTILLFLFALAVSTASQAQFREYQYLQKKARMEWAKKAPQQPAKSAAAFSEKSRTFLRKAPALPDTVYSIGTRKRHGWFEPNGILTKEQAAHRYATCRFTRRNARGRWCKMETINAYGGYAPGLSNPYILKLGSVESDSLANKEWAERVKTACIFEFVPDPSGENIVQERAYDKDMNVVYIYSRTPFSSDSLGPRQYIGAYKDIYGLPAEMRQQPGYTYGTLVLLTEDRWGNDSIVQYLDARGRAKPNSEGVAMEAYIYDERGNCLRQQSRDAQGNLVIDNWGNCGVEYTYYDTLSLQKSALYMDDRWQPMRIPGLRENKDTEGVFKVLFEYDSYGRLTEQIHVTPENKPDTSADGIHRYVLGYDERGNTVSTKSYGLDGRLKTNKYGYAVALQEYDSCGRVTEIRLYDRDDRTVKSFTHSRLRYDNEGNRISYIETVTAGNRTDTTYHEFRNEAIAYTKYADQAISIDSLDEKGRTVCTAWYDWEMNPIVGKYSGYHKEKTDYKEIDDGIQEIHITDFDEKGNPCGEFPDNYYTIDSLRHTKWVRNYDASGHLVGTCLHKLDARNEKILAQSDANAFGRVCRAGGISGVRHYNVDILYTQKGNFASFVGKDEFGEPDYIDANTGLLYYYQNATAVGQSKFYDEDNREITDMDELRDACPKAMTIEIVDSTAYRLGLQDNDLILKYGDYAIELEQIPTLDAFRAKWAIYSVLGARKKREMVVFRVNPQTREYGLVRIDNLAGTDAELGFIAHIRYLTRRQKKRLVEAIDRNMASPEALVSWDDFNRGNEYEGDNTVLFNFTNLYRNRRNTPYGKQITVPAILLAFCSEDGHTAWETGEDFDGVETMIEMRNKPQKEYPRIDFCFTTDLQNIKPLNTKEQVMGINLYDFNVSDKLYDQIANLTKQARKQMLPAEEKRPVMTQKEVRGIWKTSLDINNEPWEIILSLGKKNEMQCFFLFNQSGKIDAQLSITADFVIRMGGKWSIEGDRLNIENDTALADMKIHRLDIEGVDEEMKKALMPQFEEFVKQMKHELTGACVAGLSEKISSPVRSCSEEELILLDGTAFTRLGKAEYKEMTEKF